MTDPRKPIADAVRAAGGSFNRPGAVDMFDRTMDALGVPRLVASSAEDAAERHPSVACFALIQQFEGFAKKLPDGRVQAYPDPATGGDPWTIGWGTTGKDVVKGTIWTREKADQRFRDHVDYFAKGVSALIGSAPTTQNQFDAMVSLAYNIGLGNFGSSTLLRRHKESAYAGAALEFTRWNRADGKAMPGLTRRRAVEADLYRGRSA